MLKLQFLTCKKYSEEWSTVKNCNFSKVQFFNCTSTVIPLYIFVVQCNVGRRLGDTYCDDDANKLKMFCVTQSDIVYS